MSKYRDVFPKRHTFLAVVHVQDAVQARRNTSVALAEGADGVFLINHSIRAVDLLRCYEEVRERNPDAWIGLNFLDLTRIPALHILDLTVSGLWVDNAGMDEDLPEPELPARDFYHKELLQSQNTFRGLYFGGVAFKGQQPVQDPARMARLAAPYMHAVTTSGQATGLAPNVQKIRSMKSELHGYPLAVASGMTPENVDAFLPYVDCFLVATGVGRSFTELDPPKVRAFAKKMEL